MIRKAEYRVRAQRFLTGNFNAQDLTSLLLFLRENSYGASTVHDIGNMIGHAYERDRGLILSRINDTYQMAKLHAEFMT